MGQSLSRRRSASTATPGGGGMGHGSAIGGADFETIILSSPSSSSSSSSSTLPARFTTPPPSTAYRDSVGNVSAISPLMLKDKWCPPLGVGVTPAATQFAVKKAALEEQLRHMHKPNLPPLVLKLHRETAFEESLSFLTSLTRERLLAPLFVSFYEEEGKDDGGLSRHFFEVIAREAQSPHRSLFRPLSSENPIFDIFPSENANSPSLLHHSSSLSLLQQYRFLGMIFGKALFDGFIVPLPLSPVFCKRMLGRKIVLEDMATVDPQFYDSLAWMLENDISDDLGMFFVTDEEVITTDPSSAPGSQKFKKTIQQKELVAGGSLKAVNNENKREYVDLLTQTKLGGGGTERQMAAFLEGFKTLIPLELIAPLEEGELELLLCGMQAVDVEDWKRHTVYKAGYSDSHRVIRWFWEIVEEWDGQKRSKLLQFVTGTSMLPSEGFQGLFGSKELRPFHIQQIRDRRRLPQASTCANELWLPAYRTKQQLEANLLRAMTEGGERFGLR